MNEGLSNEALQYWYGQNTNTTFRCEERLKPLCEEFHNLFPECTPAEGNRSSWYAGLRVPLREFGEVGGVEFISWSKRQLKNSPLTIVDCHSINHLIPGFKKFLMTWCLECQLHLRSCRCQRGSDYRRQKYGGEYADFFDDGGDS